jgi:hypothetical protein
MDVCPFDWLICIAPRLPSLPPSLLPYLRVMVYICTSGSMPSFNRLRCNPWYVFTLRRVCAFFVELVGFYWVVCVCVFFLVFFFWCFFFRVTVDALIARMPLVLDHE